MGLEDPTDLIFKLIGEIIKAVVGEGLKFIFAHYYALFFILQGLYVGFWNTMKPYAKKIKITLIVWWFTVLTVYYLSVLIY